MHTFRLLHISDLHLARRPNEVGFFSYISEGNPLEYKAAWNSSHSAVKLSALSWFVHHHAKRLDVVLVTGDIATSGNRNDLRRAMWFVDGPQIHSSWLGPASNQFSATLQRGDIPVRVMPGNHDRFWDAFLFPPGNMIFDKVFQKYWKVGQGVQIQIVLRAKGGNDQLAVISADCTLASLSEATLPLGHLAQGRARTAIVDRLVGETRLVSKRSQPTAVIWALHFPPKPVKKKWWHNLINDEQLLAKAKENGVTCILCGHFHETLQYNPVGHESVFVSIVGTACRAGNTRGEISICEVDVANSGIVGSPRIESYRWDGNTFSQQ